MHRVGVNAAFVDAETNVPAMMRQRYVIACTGQPRVVCLQRGIPLSVRGLEEGISTR